MGGVEVILWINTGGVVSSKNKDAFAIFGVRANTGCTTDVEHPI